MLTFFKKIFSWNVLSVFKLYFVEIRQKGESQNGGNKKARQAIFSEKWRFLAQCAYVCLSEGKKCSFFGKIGMLCFSCCLSFKICPFVSLLTICRVTLKAWNLHGLKIIENFTSNKKWIHVKWLTSIPLKHIRTDFQK